MKSVVCLLLLLLSSSSFAQSELLTPDQAPQPLASNTLSYFLPTPPDWLLHFPRHRTYTSPSTGNDTTVIATGLAERFSSPYAKTYLDSVACAISLPTFVDVPGNDVAVLITGSKLNSDKTGVYADYNHVIYRRDLHPSVSDTNHGATLHIAVPHVAVDSTFFVTLVVADTNSAEIKLGIAIDSVTYSTPPPFDDNLYRTREVGPGGQVYLFDRGFTGDMDPSKRWYSNALFTARVSDDLSDVADLHPTTAPAAYPNPASRSIALPCDLITASSCEVEVTDDKGAVVRVFTKPAETAGKHNIPLDVSSLSPGSYHYQLKAGEKVMSGRFEVAR
jgi:hypothetical protein